MIGAGFMGRTLASVASDLPCTQCVGVADVDLTRARALANDCGGDAYADFNALLDRAKPEAVIIATPEPYHRAPVVAAAEHGCDIFIEKPLATNLRDADAMIEACEHARVKLMTGYILRFEPSYALIQSAIAEGSIGRVLSMYARRVATIDEARRLGGRVSPVTYIGVHDFDQMLWYHPLPVKAVTAHALRGRVWEELGTYDHAWITIEFSDGALGIEQVGWGLPEEWANARTPASWGGFGDVRMNVIGTDGALELNMTPMELYGCTRAGWKLPDTRHWSALHGKLVGAVRLEVEHFIDCLLHDTEPLVQGTDGRRSLEIALAAEQSIRENCTVALPLELELTAALR